MGVFTCQICGELDSYEYNELLQELRGQASDGWSEGFEQHEIHTSEGDIYVSFYDSTMYHHRRGMGMPYHIL